jgi:hypothetical protein
VCFLRRAPVPAVESRLDAPPAWAQFSQRRALLRMPSRLGRTRWQTQSRAGQHRILGISWADVCGLADGWLGRLAPLPERPAAARRLVRELYLAGYGLGWVVGAVHPDRARPPQRCALHDAALGSYLESGLGKEIAVQRWRGHWDVLMELLWVAFHDGYLGAPAGSRADRGIPVGAVAG